MGELDLSFRKFHNRLFMNHFLRHSSQKRLNIQQKSKLATLKLSFRKFQAVASYLWGRLETGYSPYAERTVMSKLEELEYTLKDPAQIAFMQKVDNVLFSHGGLTTDFVRWLYEELLDANIDDVL